MIPEDIPESEIISYLLNKNHPLQMVYVLDLVMKGV